MWFKCVLISLFRRNFPAFQSIYRQINNRLVQAVILLPILTIFTKNTHKFSQRPRNRHYIHAQLHAFAPFKRLSIIYDRCLLLVSNYLQLPQFFEPQEPQPLPPLALNNEITFVKSAAPQPGHVTLPSQLSRQSLSNAAPHLLHLNS
jgi:hypothetical protein